MEGNRREITKEGEGGGGEKDGKEELEEMEVREERFGDIR